MALKVHISGFFYQGLIFLVYVIFFFNIILFQSEYGVPFHKYRPIRWLYSRILYAYTKLINIFQGPNIFIAPCTCTQSHQTDPMQVVQLTPQVVQLLELSNIICIRIITITEMKKLNQIWNSNFFHTLMFIMQIWELWCN